LAASWRSLNPIKQETIMRSLLAILACVAGAGLTVALADPPAAPASSSEAATQATPATSGTPGNPAAAPTAAAAPAAATSAGGVTITGTAPVTPAAPQSDPMEKHFLSEGYKIEMHNGEKYFCRREEEMGSRLGGQKYCSKIDQLKATEKEAKASLDKSMMQQNNPSGK
jgi:hypothetical protein